MIMNKDGFFFPCYSVDAYIGLNTFVMNDGVLYREKASIESWTSFANDKSTFIYFTLAEKDL